MKKGIQYELFVYEKFKSFFKDFSVTHNDKILGNESKMKRQIDVSIKGTINQIDLLYVVQCKDYTRPADITKIGEFASVIRDIGASKGFLVCSSGFSKNIYNYAKTHGIEILSVEDLESEKWQVSIEIPILYIQNHIDIEMQINFAPNIELVNKNNIALKITMNDYLYLSLDGGVTTIKINEYINHKINRHKDDLKSIDSLELLEPNLRLKFQGVWVQLTEFKVCFIKTKKYYLKYVSPDEYSQITDHLKGNVIPLKLKLNVPIKLDSTFIQISEHEIPAFTNFNLEIEENIEVNLDSDSITNSIFEISN